MAQPSSLALSALPMSGPSDAADVRIGCSGWNYPSWKGRFYPAGLKTTGWLRHYATVFDTVEVNNTFYRLPDAATFRAWRRQTPDGFLMAIKGSRFLTHIKRLRDPAEPIERLVSRAGGLGPRLGPLLYQLPSSFHCDVPRLQAFLDALPRMTGRRPRRRLRHVIEFRHPSWYVDAVFGRLEQAGVSLCLHDKTGSAVERPIVGPFVYARFHGPNGHYGGNYPHATLLRWAELLAGQYRAGRDVFAFFNNDMDGHAVSNARTLRQLLAAHGVSRRQ